MVIKSEKNSARKPNGRKQKVSGLYGLVLSGGKSLRMGKDKSMLNYHGRPQTEFCFKLLSGVCERVFISNRKEQEGLSAHRDLPQIHDDPIFAGIGPLAGILTAMQKFPLAAWLVLAVDLPFVDKKILEYLISKRNSKKIATAYKSSYDGLPEPLCAIYEPRAVITILKYLKEGYQCPRKILLLSKAALLEPKNKKALDNINTKEEYESLGNLRRNKLRTTQQKRVKPKKVRKELHK